MSYACSRFAFIIMTFMRFYGKCFIGCYWSRTKLHALPLLVDIYASIFEVFLRSLEKFIQFRAALTEFSLN